LHEHINLCPGELRPAMHDVAYVCSGQPSLAVATEASYSSRGQAQATIIRFATHVAPLLGEGREKGDHHSW
jgi:hypothetical protein